MSLFQILLFCGSDTLKVKEQADIGEAHVVCDHQPPASLNNGEENVGNILADGSIPVCLWNGSDPQRV